MEKNYFKKMKFKLILVFLLSLMSGHLWATDYYVSALTGVEENNGLTPATAFRTIQRAANSTNPGSTVYIMDGNYNSTNGPLLTINRSGNASNYITFKPLAGHSPKLTASGNVWDAVVIDASYIVFEGLELEGNNANLTLAGAQASYEQSKISPPTFNANFNTNAISVAKTGNPHHIIIRNLKVHDFPAGGIGVGAADYITIENNLVYNNSWYTMYATSGISIFGPQAIDAVTTYKIIIRGNICYGNKTQIKWRRSLSGVDNLSDGNGIIIDANNGTQGKPVYTGRTLVENNVSYNNGGSGIHAYQAVRVDIINNTAYNNGTVVGYAEIFGQECSDVKIFNNIMFARTGGNCNANDAGAVYDYNLYFNGPSFRNGSNDKTGNPNFVTVALDATANFRLQNTSPAVNNGSNTAGQFAANDVLGLARPIGFASDMGAYENPTVIARPEMLVKQGIVNIPDNTGSFDFGDVASTAPQIVTFTIQNIGDLVLNLTGTPKVVVAGTGFSLETDAPATVSANGSVTFQVRFAPTSVAVFPGTVSIANNDADENPYNFAITGYGYDGTKILQTITFNSLPTKVVNEADFNPGAISSAGLPITYTSSAGGVATIVSGQIRLVNPGTTTITASQGGDGNTNPAKSVTQILTVIPVLPPAGTNMVTNPTFDADTTGWSLTYRNGGAATITSVALPPSTTNVGKVTASSLGTTTGIDNIQLSTRVFLVKDKNYIISFKANADAARVITFRLLQDVSPFGTLHTIGNIPLTTTQTSYGPYTYTSSFTGFVALRFFVAGVNIPAYFDDVSIVEENLTLSVDKFEASTDVVFAYPNPVKDLLTVYFSGKSKDNMTLALYDLQGRVQKENKYSQISEGTNAVEFNVDSIINGMYFLKVSDDNGLIKTLKVMIQK
ncbi:Por secretion system C-terminal sorting domain-containing protein [Flavobacterium fryxellicola]|uniref:choice-of-anchor D domain-containing protein n=1 Tax=Flavobacterium fryxellicola TaxID=249352 RepID=UPI000824BFE4|nr:choice-of-anchor D domain-containing protein [Flavobacterium fryxellicola]SHN74970.1 Por secretion system C-terminal sorting domain-containing protein [Flavobacterium fryxellicola]